MLAKNCVGKVTPASDRDPVPPEKWAAPNPSRDDAPPEAGVVGVGGQEAFRFEKAVALDRQSQFAADRRELFQVDPAEFGATMAQVAEAERAIGVRRIDLAQ